MRIQFERSGGFAGMHITATFDTDSLPPEEGDRLREMVEAADFFNLPPTSATRTAGADQFQYKVTVEAEGRQHTVETGDATAPDTLSPLLRRLTVLARSGQGS